MMVTMRLTRRQRWRQVILPAIFPSYVTGGITAAGGAWNASIVAELVDLAPPHPQRLWARRLHRRRPRAQGKFALLIGGGIVMSAFVVDGQPAVLAAALPAGRNQVLAVIAVTLTSGHPRARRVMSDDAAPPSQASDGRPDARPRSSRCHTSPRRSPRPTGARCRCSMTSRWSSSRARSWRCWAGPARERARCCAASPA